MDVISAGFMGMLYVKKQEVPEMSEHKTPRMIGVFIVICLVLGIIITASQYKQQPLQGYVENGNEVKVAVMSYVTPDPRPAMQDLEDVTVGLRFSVPMGWRRVIKNGWQTYIDPETAAYAQIQKYDYEPGICSAAQSDVEAQLAQNGAAFVSFAQDGNYGNTVLYQRMEDGVIYDYVEITRVDLEHIVKVILCCSDEKYADLQEKMNRMRESVKWEPKQPIPEGFLLIYNAFGNFEFAVPTGWQRGIEQGEYVALDPATGTEIHVSVTESDANYANTNQAKYAEYTSAGKVGFSVREFTASDNMVYALSAYMLNDIPMYRVEYLLATGTYEYGVTFICPVSVYSKMVSVFESAFSLFRTF